MAVIAFVLFVVAGVLELTQKHLDWVIWLLIFGGLLVSAQVAWGWAGPRYFNRGPRGGAA